MIIEGKEKETVIKYSLKEKIIILLKGKIIIPNEYLDNLIVTLATISFRIKNKK